MARIRPGDIVRSYDFYGEGMHRVLVVSREELNRGDYVVTVVFTSRRLAERRDLPSCVFFPAGSQIGLDEDCVAQCESIPQTRILHLEFPRLGHVGAEKMAEINLAINYVIDNG